MSKKDKLNKEIDILRERRKDWFNVLLVLASAVLALIYAVISGEKPLYTLLLSAMGFVAVLFIAFYYKAHESEIALKLRELEKEE